jgi:hypothetical protein
VLPDSAPAVGALLSSAAFASEILTAMAGKEFVASTFKDGCVIFGHDEPCPMIS